VPIRKRDDVSGNKLRNSESLLNPLVPASMKMDRVGTVEDIETRPEKFGRYILLDRIGVGGMAEIFRAVMPGVEGFQRTFVIKRILAERAQSPYFVDMFVQEARINAVLHHPNIVQVFDFGHVAGTYFLAMEYVRGRDVSEVLRRLRRQGRQCPVGVAAYIAREVAVALGYAHALSGPDGQPLHIVHRDVSPSNIMCPRTGGVKLLDFGIAKTVGEAEVEKTGVGLFKGKISYIAPERIKEQPVDGRSDLFSLGIVLWELLAGRKLFRGKNELETLQNVAGMAVPLASSVREGVPPALDRIVARALSRDPAERFATGQEMAEALDGVLDVLHYPARALPDLLHELFGAELASRQIPTTGLAADLLAAAKTETSNAAPRTGSGSADFEDYSVSIGTAAPPPVRPKPGWMSYAAASIGTATLLLLLFARGGGGRSQGATIGATIPARAVAAPVLAAPVAPPPQPAAPDPTPVPTPAAVEAPDPADAPAAKPARRSHWSGKGRVARGLSVDPFAEAASRGDR
jgi:serine/threonine protein kinase